LAAIEKARERERERIRVEMEAREGADLLAQVLGEFFGGVYLHGADEVGEEADEGDGESGEGV
jgi:hypothetical protein